MNSAPVVRCVVAVCMVLAYIANAGLNGNHPVTLWGVGEVEPFSLTALVLLVLAFPELLDRFPWGPTREK